jgi:nucleoside 2-deoxyribosyltransferase
MTMHVYLAGPDVFLPDPAQRFERLKRICASHGLIGVSPLDALAGGDPADWATLPEAMRIARRNEAHIARCDIMIANLTPFRGPSADVGTAFEIGFMRALGRPIHGWTNDPRPFALRSRLFAGATADGWRDADDMLVEDFALPNAVMVDNLMIAGAIAASGGHITSADPGPAARWSELSAFEACVAGCAG